MGPLEAPAAVSTGSPTPANNHVTSITGSTLPSPTARLERIPEQDNPAFASFGNDPAIMALGEGDHTHLFLYKPGYRTLTRISDGAWDDITPAISPDGAQLAFASNRNGYWDLYLMDLLRGTVSQLTNTPEYDASPTWSPDGLWLAYESYVGGENGNLEILIQSMAGNQPPIRLTEDPAADFSPAWSPGGRLIAFISGRDGKNELWYADLDQVDHRFRKISQFNTTSEANPSWSPDGSRLAWSARNAEGFQNIVVWDATQPDLKPEILGGGNSCAWSPAGDALLVAVSTPNENYLTAYWLQSNGLGLPAQPLPGAVEGISWGKSDLSKMIPEEMMQAAAVTPTPIWSPVLTPLADVPSGRQRVVPLKDINAPEPKLQDLVDESFQALRKRTATAIGWDFLSTLENAYISLSSPVGPGRLNDWLYTGRAFAFSTAPAKAGWLVIVREDYGAQTYWRVFLRTRSQDGVQGRPMHDIPWNLSARFNGDPLAYEQGGALDSYPPAGYWMDFTRLAAAYGWKPQPALSTWRNAYNTARFNEYVFSDGLSWISAMLEIYPRQVINTPTPLPPPTETPIPTLSLTPTITSTRTPYPTRTPVPTRTLAPTRTPTVSRTPRATATPLP